MTPLKILLFVALIACTAGCEVEGQTTPVEQTKADARYEVTRRDDAPAMSFIRTIETLKDRQTGICYMAVTSGNGGLTITSTECDRIKAEK